MLKLIMKTRLTKLQEKQYNTLKKSDAKDSYLEWINHKDYDNKMVEELVYNYLLLCEELGFSACEMWPSPSTNGNMFNKRKKEKIDSLRELSNSFDDTLVDKVKYSKETLKNLRVYLATREVFNKSINKEYNDLQYHLYSSTAKELFTYRGMKRSKLPHDFLNNFLADGLYLSKKFNGFKFYKKEKEKWFYLDKKGKKTFWQETILSLPHEIETLSHLHDNKIEDSKLQSIEEKERFKRITDNSSKDKKDFISMLSSKNILFQKNTNPDLIRDEAHEDQAIVSIQIINQLKQLVGEFYFDKNEKLVGYANESSDGYQSTVEKDNEKK
jgi:hypothetical protein